MEDDFRLMLAVALYHNCGVEVYQRDPNCSAKLPHSALRTLHELECALSGQAISRASQGQSGASRQAWFGVAGAYCHDASHSSIADCMYHMS
jgi:hypothetical protein